jgi:hypothetical protein
VAVRLLQRLARGPGRGASQFRFAFRAQGVRSSAGTIVIDDRRDAWGDEHGHPGDSPSGLRYGRIANLKCNIASIEGQE